MRQFAIYNPHNKPVEELPYIIGFNNGGREDWWYANLIAEDGMGLGSHLCSDEGFMPGDLGVIEGTRPDRHETFKEHYPDGYRMDFVSKRNVKSDHRLVKAFELNKQLAAADKAQP